MARQPRVARYLLQSLAVVVGGSVAHFALAQVLLLVLTNELQMQLRGPVQATNLAIASTTLAQLGLFYIRAQYSTPDHATISIPRAARIVPVFSLAIAIPLTYAPSLLPADAWTVARNVAPTITATYVSAILVALLQKRILHAIAIRVPPDAAATDMMAFEPPTLASSYARVIAGTTLAATLLVLGALLGHTKLSGQLHDTETLLVVFAFVGVVLVASIAGASLGQSPGRDVVSIADRLDALGYNTRQTMAWPVVVTSFDEVGELFAELEHLRLRLAREVSLYQDALDRTRDADNAKAQFLSAVSHELRTPVNSVCGFAQLLLEGTPSQLAEEQNEDVRLIRAGGQQLLALITDILDISMIESGELSLSFTPEDIAEIIDDIVRIHRPLVFDTKVKLAADVASDLPRVICDRRRIGQVITNLVSNAIKFTEDGMIIVRGSYDARQGRVLVRIIDTGIGIPPDELAAIFEEYRQVGAPKRRKKGTGLGLAIARSIAHHHGGTLTVESTLGQGSTFTLSLPTEPVRRPASIDITREAAHAKQRRRSNPHEHAHEGEP